MSPPLNQSLTPYHASPAAYLAANPPTTNLVIGAIIIHNRRVLLIQRAPHDGFPLKWECPGGGVDATDASILDAVRREVREETGLVVEDVKGVVDVLEFEGKEDGWVWRKITFLVGVAAAATAVERGTTGDDDGSTGLVVTLDAKEHVDAAWASEEDVVAGKAGDKTIEFAYAGQRETILEVLRGVKRGEVGGVV